MTSICQQIKNRSGYFFVYFRQQVVARIRETLTPKLDNHSSGSLNGCLLAEMEAFLLWAMVELEAGEIDI
jgi:hypothetical protein